MQELLLTTPFLLAALTAAPIWVVILMAVIIVVLIILLHKELWAFFTKLETGIVLLVILTILSIVGGLLPQHLTKADVATELLGLPLPGVIESDKAAELMEVPSTSEVPPGMLAKILGQPAPEEITSEKAYELMGISPAPGMSVQQAYSSWLSNIYARNVVAKYEGWFRDKVNEREQPFRTFYKIGFFMVYHTWYYLLIAYLLFITVVCCTISRIIGYIRMGRREPHAWAEDRLKRQPEVIQFDRAAGEAPGEEAAASALTNAGFKPGACRKEGDGYQFTMNFGFKFPFVLSSAIFHLAIFLALIGFLTTSYYSWRDSIMLPVGESKEIKLVSPEMKIYKWWDSVSRNKGWEWAKPANRYDVEASFEIRCNEYFSEYITKEDWYTLKDYKSDLTILENGREIKSKIIEVNFPLTYKGIDFFQENVTKTGVLEITTPGGETLQTQAGIWGTKLPEIPGVDVKLTASSLVWGKLLEDDGAVSELGQRIRIGKVLPPKKEEWPNPGKPKAKEGMGMMGMGMGVMETEWLFVLEDGKPVEWNGYTFLLTGPYERGTGLQVVRDPGVPILWVSIIVMIIMMVLRAYFPHYIARVDYNSVDGGGRLLIAGRALGLSANFPKQAERIASILKSK